MVSYSGSFSLKFNSTHIIYENIIKCTVKENDYNYSYNPSLKEYRSSDSSSLLGFVTESYFNPYATTIGLYNDNNELLVVAKLGRPIPMINNIDKNFIIRYDL